MNEITIIQRDERRSMSALFLYPISAPKAVGGSNVVVSPSADLPELVAGVLTAAEKAALDSGDMAFEVVSFQVEAGMTNAQRIARLRAIYASRKADFDTDYTRRYQFAGTRLDAV